MKYIILIVFLSCNQSKETATSINVPRDSATQIMGDFADSLKIINSSISDYVDDVKERISKLEADKEILADRLDKETSFTVSEYKTSMRKEDSIYTVDERDKRIAELKKELYLKNVEISRLKKRLSEDSLKVSKVDQVPNEKPNDKSLIITLDKKLRGDGEISETGVSVWIMEYTKEAKKAFKGYDNCQAKDLNSLSAKEASYYQGQYFFNNISPGKYLIKVCALYGNWMVINKKDYKQEIKMLMSPPIQ